MSTASKPAVSVLSKLTAALATLMGYSRSMREELKGHIL